MEPTQVMPDTKQTRGLSHGWRQGCALACAVLACVAGCAESTKFPKATDGGRDGGRAEDGGDEDDAATDAGMADAGDGGSVPNPDDAITLRVVHVSPAARFLDTANNGFDGDVDLYANGDFAAPLLSAVSYANVSANVYRPAGSYDFAGVLHNEGSPGASSAFATLPQALAVDDDVTIVAWNDETPGDNAASPVYFAALSPASPPPAAKVRFRLFNASTRTGELDAWLDDMANQPVAENLVAGAAMAFTPLLGQGYVRLGIDLDNNASVITDDYEVQFQVDLRDRGGQSIDAFLVEDNGTHRLLLFRAGSGGEAPLVIVDEL